MFEKILIANRGEIAVRVIRACRELGIKTAAVYSEVDAESLHVRLADEAVCIGPGAAAESYLHVPNVIAAARNVGAQAIHPGAGFLAESPMFAEVCREYDLINIGPDPDQLAAAGNKSRAIAAAREAGLPILDSSPEPLRDLRSAGDALAKIGTPAMLKASAGGGGRGMRRISNVSELMHAFPQAQSEAGASFDSADLYLERLVEGARHVEIQILGDGRNIRHLGERDCSVQRRHQKVIEEAPSPSLNDKLRNRIASAATKLARELKYKSAGTVEFLVDQNDDFYFIELNARIQVEHPVSEMLTGIDLVHWQIRIAAGERINFKQGDVKPTGHAIECRLIAEDSENDWAPSAGRVTHLSLPGGPGVRVDSHIYAGYTVPIEYDSLLAKIICHSPTRISAISATRTALAEVQVEGIATNLPYLRRVLEDPTFISGTHTLDAVPGLLAPA